MRTAGRIGGLGSESTIDYYRSIIARYRARKPGAGYPHVILNSLDVDQGIAFPAVSACVAAQGSFLEPLIVGYRVAR
jgi:aspartate/glutamate racemase